METSPEGPPGIVRSMTSTAGAGMSPSCTESTILRPSAGGMSDRNGGFELASANSCAAGSRTGVISVMGATLGQRPWRAERLDSRPAPAAPKCAGSARPGCGPGLVLLVELAPFPG